MHLHVYLPHNSSALAIFLGSTEVHDVLTTSDTMKPQIGGKNHPNRKLHEENDANQK